MPENKKSKVVEDKVIRKNVTYLKCPKCKKKEGLIHDERDNEELPWSSDGVSSKGC